MSSAEHVRWRDRSVRTSELVIAIALVSVALAGLVRVSDNVHRPMADPAARRQMLALAEAVLDDQLAPSPSHCDGADPASLDPDTRQDAAPHTLWASCLPDTLLQGYTVQVQRTAAGARFGVPNDAAERVDVQVQGPGEPVSLTGYHFRDTPVAAR